MNLGVRVDTRIKENLKKYQTQLLRLKELNAKEPPTEKVAMDMLCDLFGYDLEHVFGQYGNNNGRACDAVIKDDKKVFMCLNVSALERKRKSLTSTFGR